jgi:Holliday junction resolvase RusA-like endonuclease
MSHHLVSIPAPAAFNRSNDNTHWRNRHTLTAAWREAAAWQAKRQHLPKFGMGPVHITATIHREDKRRFDLDGAAPTVKACIDGLRTAGVLDEDDTRVIPQLTIRAGDQWADAAIVLRIEPVEVAA